MKLALYQPWIYLHGGLERSLLELVKRSRHQWTIYTSHYDKDGTFPEFQEFGVRELRRVTVQRSFAGVFKGALSILGEKIPLDSGTEGLVIWCDGIGDLMVFRNDQLPVFNICSTPLRAAFDPVYQELALRNRSLAAKFAYLVLKHAFRIVDRKAWNYYRGIVVTSTEVKKRIIAGRLCSDEERMVMAYPGVDRSDSIPPVEYQPIIIVPGRIMWTKNIQQGIEAFLKAELPESWRLVIAGYVDRKSQGYLNDLRTLAGNSKQVEFVLSPTDAQLQELYRTASFCLFTPLNEDWGIVPLEAMANAKPVIANASGGPLESIVHGKTGFLLESNDMDGWSKAIQRLACDSRLVRTMGAEAHRHVDNFTWDKFVFGVDDALERWMKCPRV
jgi:glycosyltransferase involved in cell wall biosynthesis